MVYIKIILDGPGNRYTDVIENIKNENPKIHVIFKPMNYY